MRTYKLYAESGPQHRKTQVHVLELLGCTVNGPTTDDAVNAAPDTIRTYLRYLKQHGEDVDPNEPFTTELAEHVTTGIWLGNGDPYPGFPPDFEPLSKADLKTYVQRLDWFQESIMRLTADLSLKELSAKPAKGRPIRQIIEHVAGAQLAYLQSPLVRPKGLSAALRAIEQGPDLPAAFAEFWPMVHAELTAITDKQRTEQVPHGAKIWTARRGLRRCLEHAWEHLAEIATRLGKAPE